MKSVRFKVWVNLQKAIRCAGFCLFIGGAALSQAGAAEVDPVKARSHWAFQPLQETVLPSVQEKSWPVNQVDYFLLASQEKEGIKPSNPASKAVLLRRATYGLTGLPPTFEELEKFLQDSSPTAFETVIERLLSSPAYGEHWARKWLDVARYADTAGETADYPVPEAWRYRNYVIDALNQDKPYDVFLREQIAGDILAKSGPPEKYPERVVATGFLALSRRFGFDSENYHHLTIQDTLDTLGQAVLGLSIGCARCHDHKYDPISATDYYALYGIFESTRYSFPGSEQKQRKRVMVPLIAPEQSQEKWREFQSRVALVSTRLAKHKQSAPSGILRSADDFDGDFEMQAPAAGGSRGVVVPPWFYSGEVSAVGDAQSPFQNLFPKGGTGVLLGSSTNTVTSLYQGLHFSEAALRGGKIWINLDFKILSEGKEKGFHSFWIGGSHRPNSEKTAAFQILFAGDEVRFVNHGGEASTFKVKTKEWNNLQLELDLKERTINGVIGSPENIQKFSGNCLPEWNGNLNYVSLVDNGNEIAAPLQLDNFSVEKKAIPPVSREFSWPDGGADEFSAGELASRIEKIVGLDGDFEFQTEGSQPSEPWRPGPNSKVKLTKEAQSPFQNIYPSGSLGIHMDNSGVYDGFEQPLKKSWTAGATNILYAGFDFRCIDQKQGGSGSWRFYLGHGAGSSAAVELYFNEESFFIRNGESREAVATIQIGEWNQVQLALNLKEKSYTGTIASKGNKTGFAGKFAPSWDGTINHTFVDSYGHLDGVRPGFDGDNFTISDNPLPAVDAPPVMLANNEAEIRASARKTVRKKMEELRTQLKKDRQELERLLSEGPVPIAYAVVEGTPHDSPIHLRGEPDKLGSVVPRGFLSQLGGSALPKNIKGSGRLELAEWLLTEQKALTARVMVNRIWLEHFGQGLVTTPNDFGLRGQSPSHPDLLDYLADYFIRGGWSVKAMHRLIMQSAAYQQGEINGNNEKASRLFAGFKRKRLTAEELRDSILFTSGQMNPSLGGSHPFPPPFTWGYSQHGPFHAVYEHDKRSIYLMQQRIKRHPFLALFDGADPNASVGERRTTTVPTQALFFLNDPFVHQKSGRLAGQIYTSSSATEERVQQLWQRILARNPSPEEKQEGIEFLKRYEEVLSTRKQGDTTVGAIAALARTLFGSNEFLHID